MPITANMNQIAKGFNICLAAALVLQAGPIGAADLAPSQAPLLNRATLPPAPNVLLSVDDSGSMTYQYLPEGVQSVNGKEVTFPVDARLYLHPRERPENRYRYSRSGDDFNRFITSIPNPQNNLPTGLDVFQMQMRSPQVNKLYYNPYVRYEPWRTADNRPYTWKNTANQPTTPDFTRVWLLPAYLHPDKVVPTTADEFIDLTASSTQSVRWYCPDGVEWRDASNRSRCNTVATSLTFNPTLLYMLNAGADPNLTSSYRQYDLNTIDSVTWSDPLAKEKRTDCSLDAAGNRVCSREQELRNFATWFAFHRSRLFVAQFVLPEVLRESQEKIRLGWGTIHPKQLTNSNGVETGWGQFDPDADLGQASASSTPVLSPTVQQGVRELGSAHNSKFVDWLRNVQTYRFTPTVHTIASVGEYFKRTGPANPWQNDMSKRSDDSKPLACRRSFHLLVTDGYFQTDGYLRNNTGGDMFDQAGFTLEPVGNVDGTQANAASFPGTRVNGVLATRNVFADSYADTAADYAMKYWAEDLQPDNLLPNEVDGQPIKTFTSAPSTDDLIEEVQNNPARHQHLSQLLVGFGVTGTRPTDKESLQQILEGQASWPDPTSNDAVSSPTRIDDLWHAAINSRGRYFQADNPQALQDKLKKAIQFFAIPAQKEGGLATASSVLEAGNTKYVPQYSAEDWSGDLIAYPLNEFGVAGEAAAQASKVLPSSQQRNIAIWQEDSRSSVGSPSGRAVDFPKVTNTSTARACVGCDDLDVGTQEVLAPLDLLDFMRGADPANANYRKRKNKLPDFINSTPLFVRRGVDLGYGSMDWPTNAGPGTDAGTGTSATNPIATAYKTYLAQKGLLSISGTTPVRSHGRIFIGGNGGMLHVFRGNDLVEEFAFIPRAAVAKLPELASSSYGLPGTSHQFVVDGPLMESDVRLNNVWQNIVVGTMGAGGRSVFALTVPTEESTTMGRSNVLWEATHEDMGYITAPPQVGLAPDNTWKVFVGNGVNNTSSRAALLIIDVATGKVTSYQVDTSNQSDKNHGMGGVQLVRDPKTGVVTQVYGGDTAGRLWRFDLSSPDGTSLAVAAKHVFTTQAPDTNTPQPILASPYIRPHPEGGNMVVFNTGRLLYQDDLQDKQVQSAYGVWDRPVRSSSDTAAELALTRDSLLQQSILETIGVKEANSDKVNTFFTLSRDVINWSIHRGWVLDLVFKESSATDAPLVRPKALYEPLPFGQSILITSVKPGPTAPSCEPVKAKGYSFLIKTLTGAAPAYAPLDTNKDNQFKNDVNAAGFAHSEGQRRIITEVKDPEDSETDCTKGSFQFSDDDQFARDCNNRRIKDRIWRQLLNPPAPQ